MPDRPTPPDHPDTSEHRPDGVIYYAEKGKLWAYVLSTPVSRGGLHHFIVHCCSGAIHVYSVRYSSAGLAESAADAWVNPPSSSAGYTPLPGRPA